jgi:hypothetical protein
MSKIIALNSEPKPVSDWLQIVKEKVEGLSYGEVHITVHDHHVTQIEHREKVRFQLAKQNEKRG